jgi:hypothetical protein
MSHTEAAAGPAAAEPAAAEPAAAEPAAAELEAADAPRNIHAPAEAPRDTKPHSRLSLTSCIAGSHLQT